MPVIVWMVVFAFLWRWAKLRSSDPKLRSSDSKRQEAETRSDPKLRSSDSKHQAKRDSDPKRQEAETRGGLRRQEQLGDRQERMQGAILKEGYMDGSIAISPQMNTEYQAFLAIYQPLMTRWGEGLEMAYQLEQPPPTVAGPPPKPSSSDLQRILQGLLQQGKPFPPVPASVPPFPPSIRTVQEMENLLPQLPTDVQPYQNALDWMNDQFLRSQRKLQGALRGEGFQGFEGFQAGQCAAFQSCYQQMQAGQAQRAQQIQQEFKNRLDAFQSPRLRQAFDLNERLGREIKEIQRKAQSGDWIKDVAIPDKGPKQVYELPEGADALEQMRLKDPAKYAEYQKKFGSMFSIKVLTDQINQALR